MGYEAAGTTISLTLGVPSLSVIPVGADTSPAVKLSPKARNRVRVICGIAVTVTENEQDADAAAVSVAVHCTLVVPAPNADPDGRVQLTEIGATPPLVVGAG